MKKIFFPLIALVAVSIVFSCNKPKEPALPKDYPTDNPVTPTTPLRFFVSFDSTKTDDKQVNIRFKDSISQYPSFFPDPSITVVPGVTGTAMGGSAGAVVHYTGANDFSASSSFTIAFWLKATIDQKDHVNADGILSLPSTVNFWSNVCIFADHESSTSDSLILKFHFANGTGDNWDFQYANDQRLPHGYDGNWHHIAFTYDAGAKTGKLYYDGQVYDTKTNETIAFDGKAAGLILGGFQEMLNIVDQWSNNGWQSGWPGDMDQVRLYNAALAAADITGLYTSKQ